MTEVRCTNCNALLFKTELGTVIIEGKSVIEIKPQEKVKAKCKCGKLNFVSISITRELDIYSGSRGSLAT